MRSLPQIMAILTLLALLGRQTAAQAPLHVGVSVPEGFEVTLYADSDLANDIFCMTVDSLGRVAVSGPGYVRLLVDDEDDGQADRFLQFADGPATGAQGLYFFGRDLFCVGDAGLLRYRDEDHDDRADGSPDVFLKVKTGGEHHAHALHKGPDGAWYLLAGNDAGITDKYATLPTSPIKHPMAGALLRLERDLSGGEVVADGFRNPYDFAFHALGDVFVYDSDGERDVSLPWYRPTRVFQALPGSNAGWVSRSWKRPDDFPDMPPVVASFGRGSPTGVVCYRHRHFPAEYRDAVFVLDWTFGRVLALPLVRHGAGWTTKPIEFMQGVGQHGFAPTDAAVGKDGSLFVSVGGRGTRGGVYRVRWKGSPQSEEIGSSNPTHSTSAEPSEKLLACLESHQPLSSWSRAEWVPLARELGARALTTAVLNEELPAAARVRAIEILTELYDGFDAETLRKLARAEPADVRARAIWSAGRTGTPPLEPPLLFDYLNDADPLVVRSALEAVARIPERSQHPLLLPMLVKCLGAGEPIVRHAASRVVSTLTPENLRRLSGQIPSDDLRARVAFDLGRVALPSLAIDRTALETGLTVVEANQPAPLKLEAVRLMQLALGDVGPARSTAPVFDGYTSQLNLRPEDRVLDPICSRLADVYPTGDDRVDHELARLLSMLGPNEASLLDKLLAKISDESDPVEDIHQLIVAARVPVARSESQRTQIARALVNLDPKIESRGLNQDRHWDQRVGEMYRALVKLDPALPSAVIEQPGFGRSGHVVFLADLNPDQLQAATNAIVRHILQDEDFAWTPDIVFLLGKSDAPEHRDLLRGQFDHFGVRSAVLVVLAEQPEDTDRAKFVAGLDSSQVEVLKACLDALQHLVPSRDPAEQVALLRTLRRLGTSSGERKLREQVASLLRRNTGESFSFEPAADQVSQDRAVVEWTDWITREYPDEAASQLGGSGSELEELADALANVDWSSGDVFRGRKLFEKRSCAQCHAGRRSLGPDLAGVAQRFSRNDLWTAIAMPGRDVSPRYQTTMIQTSAGRVYTGLIIYESVDGLILRDAQNQTYRIEADDIEDRGTMNTSLMPAGLLKGMTSQDLADLYAYLRSLGDQSQVINAAGGD